MPRVSVIIPTFNRAEYLRLALASVFRQTFQDFEVLIVDDGSTDNTADVVASIEDLRLRYFSTEANKGGSAARNAGIRNATAKYLAFLDDDDEWAAEKLSLQVRVLDQADARVGAVYTGYTLVDAKNGRIMGERIPVDAGDITEKLMEGNCVGTTSTLLIRKECFNVVGSFDENLPSFQDHDMWIRIARTFSFQCIPQPMVLYRVHGKKIWTDINAMSKGMDRMLAKYGNSAVFRRSLSYSYLRLGVECITCGDVKRGRTALRRAIGLYPYEVRHYFNLGLSLLGAGGFRTAKKAKDGLRLLSGNRPQAAARA